MSEPVQLEKTWMHAKERRKLLKNCAIGSIFRFWTKKWTCEKVNFCCDWRGSYLRCPSQCSLEKHERTRKNDENCSKTERLAAFSVFGPSEILCEIVWNSKTVKNAYFSKILNSLKVSEFFPNCSRNNRVSTSKNKGVDFSMQGNRTYMSITLRHTTHEYTLKFMHFLMK